MKPTYAAVGNRASTTAEKAEAGFWRSCPKLTIELGQLLRRSFASSLDHDILTVGQATAYSAVVALFPTLIVAAAVVSFLPDSQPLRLQLAVFFARVLPSNVSPILAIYFVTTHKNPQTTGALLSAAVVSLTGAASVMATLMEGFRRAHRLQLTRRSFWPRRRRALVLVPLSLVPMAFASSLVVFGHFLTQHLAAAVTPALQVPVMVMAFLLRWTVALAGSVAIIAVIYHLGSDINMDVSAEIKPFLREPLQLLRKEWSWRASLPGAMLATLLWFVSTLLFGLYVTRFANYSRVYGSLGAGIALMIWLYIIAICILFGAEFNAQIVYKRRQRSSFEERTSVEDPSSKLVSGR